MLKDAPVIILDEATAAVDAENEALIPGGARCLSRNKTVVTIAHHLNAVRDADQIVVMQEGRIVGSGTHEQLMHMPSLSGDGCQAKTGQQLGTLRRS